MLRSHWSTTIVSRVVDQEQEGIEASLRRVPGRQAAPGEGAMGSDAQSRASHFSALLTGQLLEKVTRPGQYLGNEWGAYRKDFDQAETRLVFAFPDLYELGMSNFGLKILYQVVNRQQRFLADRTYALGEDLEKLARQHGLELWAWESRRPLRDFELIGFSLQYELTYTNVLNMLDLSGIPLLAIERTEIFPLIFGGGPSAVNPEPMAEFMDFFIIGDGESAVPSTLETINNFQKQLPDLVCSESTARKLLLWQLAVSVPGVYVPQFYAPPEDGSSRPPIPKPVSEIFDQAEQAYIDKKDGQILAAQLPSRVMRQTEPLTDANQPTSTIVPYLSLVQDREVIEVRRGCDRGCRFCQPGYTFLPVRERTAEELVDLSKKALANSGHQEYSMLSLCVSDYTSLHDSVRALNEEHSARRSSLSFPSQRADRMNLDLAEELKVVRKSGITLAPEAGTDRLRAVINKGLSHEQIISAIAAAYQSGWASVKLYFMCGLPTETDEDLQGIIDILKEASLKAKAIRRTDMARYKKELELTCTISNFVPKPFTPFQWFAQVPPGEMARRHQVLRHALRAANLRSVTLNITDPQISLLESVISRGDRRIGKMIGNAFQKGAIFDAWDDKFQPQLWHEVAREMGWSLEEMACSDREVGSDQPWDVVHIGLHNWWLVREWEKAMATLETANCTENTCHACGVCTELDTTHELSAPNPEVVAKNPFVKDIPVRVEYEPAPDPAGSQSLKESKPHPSIEFETPDSQRAQSLQSNESKVRMRFKFTKLGDLRFISHLDLQMLLTRAARRAAVNIAYSQGFNPQAKLSLAAPLSLFQESECEIAELDIVDTISEGDFIKRMNEKLPLEVQIVAARSVALGKKDSLASLLEGAIYEAVLNTNSLPAHELASLTSAITFKVQEILNSTSYLVDTTNGASADAKTGQRLTKDLRPFIRQLDVLERNPLTIKLELAHGSKAHVKPTDILAQLIAPTLDATSADQYFSWKIKRLALLAALGADLFLVGV
jgi:radical SAM family uncharacterized protein/radical SAM-linked protein